MNKLTSLFKALSDRNRLRIVAALLKNEELCACQIIELMQVTGATVSRHMGLLINAGLVVSRKEGRWVHYRLRRDVTSWLPLMEWLEAQIADDLELAADLSKLAEITACDPEDIRRKQRAVDGG
ncbi:MAG: ArsR family transcriptional regulator [Desulfobulbaceae bacterium]|nr:MAG: ArsR family transcriptional regulator [Desulfobulbaceae bacterium]